MSDSFHDVAPQVGSSEETPLRGTPTRETPLHAEHARLGASFTDFGGWLMPVRYASELAEHRAVREAAGLFDISHMAEFLIDGPGAGAFLDYALSGRLSTLGIGRAKYTLLLQDDGGVIDDVIVYRLADDRYLLIANAGNHAPVASALNDRVERFLVDTAPTAPASVPSAGETRQAARDMPHRGMFRGSSHASRPEGSFGFIAGAARRVDVADISAGAALLAVQGPAARAVLDAVGELTDYGRSLDDVIPYSCVDARFAGHPVLVARTGYTGEDGYELLIGAGHAVALWRALIAAGTPLGLVPAGLAARDTLRLEAGMPLYGHELTRDIRPAQAGLAHTVALDKGDFVGALGLRTDLVAVQADAPSPVLVGLVSTGRRAGRAGYAVYAAARAYEDGDAQADTDTAPDAHGDARAATDERREREVGVITSGALSPTLGYPIALAYVSPRVSAPGTLLHIDIRGTRIPATVTLLPFYRRKK